MMSSFYLWSYQDEASFTRPDDFVALFFVFILLLLLNAKFAGSLDTSKKCYLVISAPRNKVLWAKIPFSGLLFLNFG